MAAEKGLAIDVFLPPELIAYTDPVRVRQVLLNLLSNAVKFTPRNGGTILVSGRAADNQEEIFDEFTQVDRGPSRSLDGTGIGLTLARRFAILVGGQIRVESVPWVGGTFTIWLPGTAAKPERSRPAELAKLPAATAAS